MRLLSVDRILMIVSGYAVMWQNDDGMPLAGRLELTSTGLWLTGGVRGNEKRIVVPYGEMLGVERDSEARIGRCRAITVLSRNAGELLIATVGGVGLLGEIFAALQQALGG